MDRLKFTEGQILGELRESSDHATLLARRTLFEFRHATRNQKTCRSHHKTMAAGLYTLRCREARTASVPASRSRPIATSTSLGPD